MRPIVVSAHSPLGGPRHLGHYLSTMSDWPRLDRDHELFIVIDDVFACTFYPRWRKEVENRTLQVAREFMAAGNDASENVIVLTSMIPEAFELAALLSSHVDLHWCMKLHKESFIGMMTAFRRKELQLPRMPSVAEISYPLIHLAGLTLGLRADLFQGGDEMLGYLDVMTAICEGLDPHIGIKPPKLLPGRCMSVWGTDGHYMTTKNTIYVSESQDEIRQAISGITSPAVLKQWYSALERNDLAANLSTDVSDTHKDEIATLLSSEFERFRNFQAGSQDIAQLLERSSVTARERVKDTLVRVKGAMGIPVFSVSA